MIFSYDSLSPYGVAVPAIAAAIFWFEAWKVWKHSLTENASKKSAEKDYFWASLMPGLAALGVFIAAAFFLFNYIGPSGVVVTATPPVDPNSPIYSPSPGSPVVTDDFNDVPMQHPGDSPLLGFSATQVTVLLFGGSLVAGFLIFVLVRYRCIDAGVLTSEQGWNKQFGTQDYQRSAP